MPSPIHFHGVRCVRARPGPGVFLMNALNHSYSWVLSLTIHLMAAAILGWFVGRNLTRPTPDTLTFAAVDITLADTAVTAAAGAAASTETPPVPRPETPNREPEARLPPSPDTRAVETARDTSVVLPLTAAHPFEQSRPDLDTDHKTPFLPDLEMLADPAELESTASAANPGAGDGADTGFGVADIQATARAVIRPVYPISARRRNEEGRVIIEATVLASGRTAACTVVTSSGHTELDRAAEKAIQRARFVAATRRGEPIASRIRLTFIFKLHD